MLIDFRPHWKRIENPDGTFTKVFNQGLFNRWNIKPKGVLHVGANVGEEAPVYDELGIKKVIWIEGNPELIPLLSRNVSKYGHVYLNHIVGDVHDEIINFHVSNNGSQSSSIFELGTHKTAHPEVHYVRDLPLQMKRIDKIFDRLDEYDFLNIDLQGAELKALKGMGELLTHFKWAYLEVNKEELYKGCALVEDLDFYMGAYGFNRVETMWCGNTGWGDALYVKD